MDTFLLVAFLSLYVALLVWLLFWAADDARERGKFPWLVALAIVVFFPWGLLAWLAFRPEKGIPGKPRFNLDDYRRN